MRTSRDRHPGSTRVRMRARAATAAACAVLALLLAACAASDPATVPAKVNMRGAYTTLNGDELFTYEGDPGEIAAPSPWRPLTARADDRSGRDFTVLVHPDGTLQWLSLIHI